jgi:hypothetical protein
MRELPGRKQLIREDGSRNVGGHNQLPTPCLAEGLAKSEAILLRPTSVIALNPVTFREPYQLVRQGAKILHDKVFT